MRLLGLICMFSAVVISRPVAYAQQFDRVAMETCLHFYKVVNRVSDGAVTSVYGIESEMRSVYAMAEQSPDTTLREKAGDLVRQAAALRSSGTTAITDAVKDFAYYCRHTVAYGQQGGTIIYGPRATSPVPAETTVRQTRPISPEELDRQLRAVLEREGAQNAKCSKKQYGSGWVTVCE